MCSWLQSVFGLFITSHTPEYLGVRAALTCSPMSPVLFQYVPSCKLSMEEDARHEEFRREQRLFSEDIKPAPIRQIHLTSLYSILAPIIRRSSSPAWN